MTDVLYTPEVSKSAVITEQSLTSVIESIGKTDVLYTPEVGRSAVFTEQPLTSVIESLARQGPPGPPGPQGPSGESLIAGKLVQVQQLAMSDMLEFNGTVWVNVPKPDITDGGNF